MSAYDYNSLTKDMLKLENYNGIERVYLGSSRMGREIYCVKAGTGTSTVFLNGAHHGLEYLTSAFLMKFLIELMSCAESGTRMFGYDAAGLLKKVTLYIAPMINPDGVDIAVNGLDITEPAHRRLISLVGIHSFSKVWQANADGVDLNHNYNANWSMILSSPAPSLYGGEYPESEPEVKAAADFVRTHHIDAVIAFHSQGREIYYDFDGMETPKAVDIAKAMAKASGYALARPSGTAAYGGFKDWFIKEFGRAGYTVEIGAGKNPLPLEDMGGVYEENARLILECMKCVSRYGEE